MKKSEFIIDLNCEVNFTEIHLRNAHGGTAKNRYKYIQSNPLNGSALFPIKI